MASLDSNYQTVCVWVVTIAGAIVIFSFAIYFAVTVWNLATARRTPAVAVPAPRIPAAHECPCGGELGPVENVQVTDQGTIERRTCKRCHRVQLIPR